MNGYEDYCLADTEQEMEIFEEMLYEADRLSLEDKVIAAYEEETETISPWEINNFVQEAMEQLPEDLTQEQREAIYDIMYEAISSALEKVR